MCCCCVEGISRKCGQTHTLANKYSHVLMWRAQIYCICLIPTKHRFLFASVFFSVIPLICCRFFLSRLISHFTECVIAAIKCVSNELKLRLRVIIKSSRSVCMSVGFRLSTCVYVRSALVIFNWNALYYTFPLSVCVFFISVSFFVLNCIVMLQRQ